MILHELLARLDAICDIPDGPRKLQEQRHAIYVLRNELAAALQHAAAPVSLADAHGWSEAEQGHRRPDVAGEEETR